MQTIIPPVDRSLLRSELTKDKLLRTTNKSQNELYIITAHDSPSVMREIGRLRETAFRTYGGGTGLACDVDEYDTMENAYRQLVVWSPEDDCILGGYRFLCGSDVTLDEQGQPRLATSHLFHFSPRFISEYLPYTVELGRSFVTLEFQATREGARKGIFILDNLWDGLGALSVVDPTLKYFFGKMTVYNTYPGKARTLLHHFLHHHYPDPDHLIIPHHPLVLDLNTAQMQALFPHDNFKDNYRCLNQEIRKYGIDVPPLVNAYMSLSPKMRVFGTTVNYDFGDVEETGILIPIDEILEDKKKRHIETYLDTEFRDPQFIRTN